jgi:hypothetical protein
MFAFYALALVVVFLGTVINIPGSLHINPLLLHFYEPHRVLFLTMLFLVLGAISRIIVMWDKIVWRDATTLAVWGLFGGIFEGPDCRPGGFWWSNRFRHSEPSFQGTYQAWPVPSCRTGGLGSARR